MEGVEALGEDMAAEQNMEQMLEDEFFRFFAESELMDMIFEDVSEEG